MRVVKQLEIASSNPLHREHKHDCKQYPRIVPIENKVRHEIGGDDGTTGQNRKFVQLERTM
jgi:hypothetical protein